jgi:hypothetical protein
LDSIHDDDANIANVGVRRPGFYQAADLLKESVRIIPP